jgi:pyruvate dehydrogenase E2 component (dihydrolipoamide acetyltransferase)
MARAFKLPDLGEGVHEGEVLAVHVQVGQAIAEGDLILTVETDKAAVEIPSPFDGRVSAIEVEPGQIVTVGQVLMRFEDAAGSGPPPGADLPRVTPSKSVQAAVQKAPEHPAAAPSAGPVPASPATRRLARELGVELRAVPASGPKGLVTAEDVRAAAARLGARAEAPPSAHLPPDSEVSEAEGVAPSDTGKESEPPLPDFSRWGPVQRVPFRSVRRATGRRMALSWSQIPHVSSQESANVTRLEQFRQNHKATVAAQGGRLTFTVFALKAAVTALKRFPDANASLDRASGEIVRKHYFHIGVAVNTEHGLMVPVVRDVDRKSLRELSSEVHSLSDRARARKLSRAEMQGGSFTITNAGAMGGGFFTPLINYPEVAILGMGQARMQPAAVPGEHGRYTLLPQLILPLVLCIDHRVLDGADAVGFLKVVKNLLEDPDELLLDAV